MSKIQQPELGFVISFVVTYSAILRFMVTIQLLMVEK